MKAAQRRPPTGLTRLDSNDAVVKRSNANTPTVEQLLPLERVAGLGDWVAFLSPVQMLGPTEIQLLEPPRLAQILPLMRQEELNALREDVRTSGFVAPLIVVAEGGVIDGRHRLLVAKELQLGAPVSYFSGGEERAAIFVASLNLQRRSPMQSQRTAIALLRNYQARGIAHGGDRREGFKDGTLTDADLAERAGVGVRYWRAGKKLKARCPELLVEVVNGSLTIPMASTRCLGKEREKMVSCGCDGGCQSHQCPWRSTAMELEASKRLVLELRQQLEELSR